MVPASGHLSLLMETTGTYQWLGDVQVAMEQHILSLGCLFLLIHFYFLLFRATPMAYGGSQARGPQQCRI